MAVFKQKILEGIKQRGVDKYKNFQQYKDKIILNLKRINIMMLLTLCY